MKIEVSKWSSLDTDSRRELLQRPAVANDDSLRSKVAEIVATVRRDGDAALMRYTEKFDGVQLATTSVPLSEIEQAESHLSQQQKQAIEIAIANVRRFHEQQRPVEIDIETMPGVRCQRISQPIESVGLYVPAGTAPLPSAAIMLAVPAVLAGCPERILCTPCNAAGQADPAVLVAASRAGVTQIFKVGGAQAIAAMAYGTESMPRVEKIFGPGNAWVTAAKTLIAADPMAAAIDMPAGPSEVLVIADAEANAEFVAADLLSQAEHGPDSQVVLVATEEAKITETLDQIDLQLARLDRKSVAEVALSHSRMILCGSIGEATSISNMYAPEHLILHIGRPRDLLPIIRNAGSVFLGPWSPEAVGDYCSGTNHVLPTYGAAKRYSGLSVEQFMRHMTVQELTREGLDSLAETVLTLAGMEGLDGHANAVRCRTAHGVKSS